MADVSLGNIKQQFELSAERDRTSAQLHGQGFALRFVSGGLTAQSFKLRVYGSDNKIDRESDYGRHLGAWNGTPGFNGIKQMGPEWQAKFEELSAVPKERRTGYQQGQLDALKDRLDVYEFMEQQQSEIDGLEP